jgi:hypothetical protein
MRTSDGALMAATALDANAHRHRTMDPTMGTLDDNCRYTKGREAGNPASTTKAYVMRLRAQGKSDKEAMRCLKRQLSNVVFRQLQSDVVLGGRRAA